MHDHSNEQTIYFASVNDAQLAAEELQDQGYHAHLSSSDTGAGFWESVKRFFGAESTEQYGSGAILLVSGDGAASDIDAIVNRYNGRMRGEAAYAADTYDSADTGDTIDETQRLKLREERLSVDKQRVEAGEVRVGKETVTERQEVDVPVAHEEVYVERRAAAEGEYDDAGEIGDESEIRVPVMREEVSVEKHPVVAEEVEVGKRTVQETRTVGADVRKERAVVDGDGDLIRGDRGSTGSTRDSL